MAEFLFNGPESAASTLVLAHGAGAPMDSLFMETIAAGVAKAGIRVARFEFPYMRRWRETRKGGAPDPAPVLMQSWRDAIDELGGGSGLVIGGKSLGGRMASMIADETGARGLVCLGYPFRHYVSGGGLISYGPDTTGPFRSAAGYIDRILKGERPADLPVQFPTRYEMVLNMKTAKALGLVIPETLLATADEVIQ